MPKASPRTSLAALFFPLTLCSLPLAGYAAENHTLNALVAGVLEREGIIEPGTAPSTRAAQREATSTQSTDTFAANAATVTIEADDVTTHTGAPIVLGVVLVFADAEAKALSRQNLPPQAALLDALAQTTEVPLNFKRAMSMDAFVFEFDQPLTWKAFAALQQQLSSLTVIEALYPDLYQMPKREPGTAPYYYYQWSLLPTDRYSRSLRTTIVGIDAEHAWDVTTGSSEMTVAILDTGLTDPYPFNSTRVLSGYDFITDPDAARDGDGRDADPTDMGDHRIEDECEHSPTASDSSWHGTAVASLIAADGNDSTGIAGIDWRTKLLPVRVLGKCGGAVSDIVDGMMWAAGLPVPGVPNNQNPAQILNMSLGRLQEPDDVWQGCYPLYEAGLRIIRAQNVLIIAAAGNDDADMAQHRPSNCEGVLAVSAVDHLGERASYSNWNTEGKIFIAAPGGDLSKNEGWAGILATFNTGDTEPAGELQQLFTGGTSMAAAHVSGVASLAWGVDPAQRSDVIAAILHETVQTFGNGSRCAQERPLCGPGIIDAWAAVQGVQAMKPYSAVVEFYQPGLQHYFSTANSDEVVPVRAGIFGDWDETGQGFLGWRSQSEQGVLPVCRFYGTPGIGPNSHFYTVDPAECEKVKQDRGWTYEGIPFYAKKPEQGYCSFDSLPLYRYYNNGWKRNDSNHRYATHLQDRAAMEAAGWVMEGTAMCVPGQP